MPQKISIRIDGEYGHAAEGQTILEAARANGKFIPALCYMKGLTPVGACRLCVVEVSGVGRLLPACTTPVQEGMSVTTESAKLAAYRRIALELLFTERNHYCSVCVSNGHCELQTLAQKLGVTSVRYPYSYPTARRGRFAPALRAGPQPLHPLHALRARVQRSGGRPRVGHHVARRAVPPGVRDGEALGTSGKLHQLRQVRAVLPHRRAGRKGMGGRGDDQELREHQPPGNSPGSAAMSKIKLATVWLDGCSGCHMSLLDIDESIIAVAKKADIVYGPLVDAQEFPEGVDVTLVEGRGQQPG